MIFQREMLICRLWGFTPMIRLTMITAGSAIQMCLSLALRIVNIGRSTLRDIFSSAPLGREISESR